MIPRRHKTVAMQLLVAGMYSLWLNRWFRLFCPSNILLLNGDDFLTNPYPVMKKFEKFIGVKEFYRQNQFRYDERSGFYCFYSNDRPTCSSGKPNAKGNEKGATRSGKTGKIEKEDFLEVKPALDDFFRPFNRDLLKIAERYGQDFKHDWPV